MSTVSDAELTPLRFLERSAEVYPEKVAIVHGDRRTTYRDFAGEATRLARPCRRRGLTRATAWPTSARCAGRA
jgi:fatty-acyl-CoA synthase